MTAWIFVAIFALVAIFGWLSALEAERRARRAEREIAEARRQADKLEAAVRELLKTRRTTTRDRFLGLIEEQQGR